jgi:hypothetical protein
MVLPLLAAAALIQPSARAQRPMEMKPMSDASAPSTLEADANAALAEYDKTRDPEALRNVADQIVREDGAIPPDPAAALAQGRLRLKLWLVVFSRLHRDVDPDFDPDQPPSMTVAPPKIGGTQFPPGVRPTDLPDPEARRQYEEAVAANARRLEQFRVQLKLAELHDSLIERAIDSLRNARDTLGLGADDIGAVLLQADMIDADRDAVLEGLKA